MVDHNVDEVVMTRRLPDGTPDHTPGFKRIVVDEVTGAPVARVDGVEDADVADDVRERGNLQALRDVDQAQLDSIQAQADARAQALAEVGQGPAAGDTGVAGEEPAEAVVGEPLAASAGTEASASGEQVSASKERAAGQRARQEAE